MAPTHNDTIFRVSLTFLLFAGSITGSVLLFKKYKENTENKTYLTLGIISSILAFFLFLVLLIAALIVSPLI